VTPFFTSDLHFGHEAVIRFAGRPFSSTEEMDQALIDNWNATVKKKDSVFIIGDFSFHKGPVIEKIIKSLNGSKHLILGNHDKKRINDVHKKKFIWVKDLHTIKVPDLDVLGGNQLIALCHYPLLSWDRMHYGSWMLHGHCHGNMRYPFKGRILDVGVDAWGYKPVSYEQIKAKMVGVTPEFLDHHKEKYGEP
jgi:calcineurin-like phosphoesterase family protein